MGTQATAADAVLRKQVQHVRCKIPSVTGSVPLAGTDRKRFPARGEQQNAQTFHPAPDGPSATTPVALKCDGCVVPFQRGEVPACAEVCTVEAPDSEPRARNVGSVWRGSGHDARSPLSAASTCPG